MNIGYGMRPSAVAADTIDTNVLLILALPACWKGVDLRTLKQTLQASAQGSQTC